MEKKKERMLRSFNNKHSWVWTNGGRNPIHLYSWRYISDNILLFCLIINAICKNVLLLSQLWTAGNHNVNSILKPFLILRAHVLCCAVPGCWVVSNSLQPMEGIPSGGNYGFLYFSLHPYLHSRQRMCFFILRQDWEREVEWKYEFKEKRNHIKCVTLRIIYVFT